MLRGRAGVCALSISQVALGAAADITDLWAGLQHATSNHSIVRAFSKLRVSAHSLEARLWASERIAEIICGE